MMDWWNHIWGVFLFNQKVLFEIYNSTFVAGGCLILVVPLFISIDKDNRKGKKA